jgi:hypothetical protein
MMPVGRGDEQGGDGRRTPDDGPRHDATRRRGATTPATEGRCTVDGTIPRS